MCGSVTCMLHTAIISWKCSHNILEKGPGQGVFSAQGPLIAPLLDYNDCGRHKRLVLSDDPTDDCKRSSRELGTDLLAIH